MSTVLENYALYVIIGLAAVIVILIVLWIITMVRNSKMSKKYAQFMQGRDARSLEEVIQALCKDVKDNREENLHLREEINLMQRPLEESLKKVGIVRYDAFKGMKGKLSFSVCLLNDDNSGILLTNMKSTDGNYTYMKEIVNGKPQAVLGNEEKQALKEALETKGLKANDVPETNDENSGEPEIIGKTN